MRCRFHHARFHGTMEPHLPGQRTSHRLQAYAGPPSLNCLVAESIELVESIPAVGFPCDFNVTENTAVSAKKLALSIESCIWPSLSSATRCGV